MRALPSYQPLVAVAIGPVVGPVIGLVVGLVAATAILDAVFPPDVTSALSTSGLAGVGAGAAEATTAPNSVPAAIIPIG
jgi:hypothetical protein